MIFLHDVSNSTVTSSEWRTRRFWTFFNEKVVCRRWRTNGMNWNGKILFSWLISLHSSVTRNCHSARDFDESAQTKSPINLKCSRRLRSFNNLIRGNKSKLDSLLVLGKQKFYFRVSHLKHFEEGVERFYVSQFRNGKLSASVIFITHELTFWQNKLNVTRFKLDLNDHPLKTKPMRNKNLIYHLDWKL